MRPCEPAVSVSVSLSVKWGPWQGCRGGLRPCVQRSQQHPELTGREKQSPANCQPLRFTAGETETEKLTSLPKVTELANRGCQSLSRHLPACGSGLPLRGTGAGSTNQGPAGFLWAQDGSGLCGNQRKSSSVPGAACLSMSPLPQLGTSGEAGRHARIDRSQPPIRPDAQTRARDAALSPGPRRSPEPWPLWVFPEACPRTGCGRRPGPALAGAWPALLALWLADGDSDSVGQLTPLSTAVCGNFAHCPCC